MELDKGDKKLINELISLIEESKKQLALAVNSAMTFLYWRVGYRINEEILNNRRAGYGKKIVVSVSRQLSSQYGKSFEEKNLRRMIQFAQVFNEEQIVVSLIRQLR